MFTVKTTALVRCSTCHDHRELDSEDEAWAWLLDHVYVNHDWDVWPRVDALARELLNSEKFVTAGLNGWDDDASEQVKDVWRIQALKNIVEQEGRE